MAYEVEISNPNGEGIHHEMGHFLMRVKDESGETHEPDRAEIIRQATIPRANAMMTLGTIQPGAIDPNDDIYDARPRTPDPEFQETIDDRLASTQQRIHDLAGPQLTHPLTWLSESQPPEPEDPDFLDWVFDFRHDESHPKWPTANELSIQLV